MEESYEDIAGRAGVHQATQQGTLLANQNKQLQYEMEESEKNLAEAQLDCNETLQKIYHLLKQDVLKPNEDKGGILEWTPLDDIKKRVLTEEGVDKIMQIMQSYINKETLLSNFDNVMINRRMLEFSLAFSGNFFMKYEIYFRTPTLEECQKILQNRIAHKVKLRVMNAQLMNKEADEKKIRANILHELEPHIDYEIGKIKQQKTKENLREFEMLFVQLKALVEATHNRAWKGEERGSLRRHMNISEVTGVRPQMQEKKGFGWFK